MRYTADARARCIINTLSRDPLPLHYSSICVQVFSVALTTVPSDQYEGHRMLWTILLLSLYISSCHAYSWPNKTDLDRIEGEFKFFYFIILIIDKINKFQRSFLPIRSSDMSMIHHASRGAGISRRPSENSF